MKDYTEGKTSTNRLYAHYQSDVQKSKSNKRTKEQQFLVDNYFIVKNHINEKLLLATIIAFVVTFISFIINPIVGFIFIVASLALLFFCLGSTKPHHQITDKEYEDAVTNKIKELNIEARGLEKLGLDAEQIKEIKPFLLTNRVIKETSLIREDKKLDFYHSSTQNVIYLYFTNKQLFIYSLTFDMCCNLYQEDMNELFYKDICDIKATVSNSYCKTDEKEKIEEENSKEKDSVLQKIKRFIFATQEVVTKKKIEVTSTTYEVVSLNSKVVFSFSGFSNSDENNSSLETAQAMRQKIREVRYK